MRSGLLAILVLLTAGAGHAQTVTPALPTSVDVLILPATGDPLVVVPIATRTTVIGTLNTATGVVTPNGQCGRNATTPASGALVNPTQVEFDDPFAVGKKCVAFVPAGLPDGSGYRGVAVATYSGTCKSDTGQDITPCPSRRSVVGVPPFGVASGRLPPAVLTNLAVRP